MNELYNIGQALGRDEMKKLMAGSGGTGSCLVTCNNCNNSSCRKEVDDCSAFSINPVCGPNDTDWVCVCI